VQVGTSAATGEEFEAQLGELLAHLKDARADMRAQARILILMRALVATTCESLFHLPRLEEAIRSLACGQTEFRAALAALQVQNADTLRAQQAAREDQVARLEARLVALDLELKSEREARAAAVSVHDQNALLSALTHRANEPEHVQDAGLLARLTALAGRTAPAFATSMPVGWLTDGRMDPSTLTCSSTYPRDDCGPYHVFNAVLNRRVNGWAALRCLPGEWIQAAFGRPVSFLGIQLQGRGDGYRQQWVTRFRLEVSTDGARFADAGTYPGCADQHSIVTIMLPRPLAASHVRLIALEWNTWITIRWDLLAEDDGGEAARRG